jgi:hypothetical protein
MEVSGQFHAPVALLRGKSPPVPTGWEAGWVPESVLTLLDRCVCKVFSKVTGNILISESV